ncbi:DUF3341 domain-containing protein [Dyella acidiphila]|uniref:DUF3341 domain-containing protein n=1 Tax=Dyella acidiphila TaxID=2775866 RepID=A0ABR9GBX4_9GAMM|nr:DUF3341 domain-containing protein [Dyella acidiphila]MBE1161535.1 DUF3341 domain-containing protein [Dyella acidiphila]
MSDKVEHYGCMALFGTGSALIEAVRTLQARGYRELEVYTPCKLDELDRLLQPPSHRVAWAAFAGGAIGGIGTLALEYYAAVISYPIRVGGRPFASWPAFIPPALEMTFLFAAGAAVLAMLIGNRLPQWYHPVFHVERFVRVSQDEFALVVNAQSGEDTEHILGLLRSLHPLSIDQVPR